MSRRLRLASDPQSVITMLLSSVRPSPDNDKVYRPIDAGDAELLALAESIRQNGVREPLVVSEDGWLLSGHRRRAAAEIAGLEVVPVRVEAVRRSADPDKFLRLLREFNRQRIKGFDEHLREAVIDADPEECRRELVEFRRAKSKYGLVPFLLGQGRGRSEITEAKRPLAEAIRKVVEELREYWPLTIRQIHYGLLNDPPLRHASKPKSGYVNDLDSYKSLDELSVRMRLVSPNHWAHLPMEIIEDETRPITTWSVHDEVGSFVRGELDGFLKGYYRNLQRSQPNHVELVVEKNTVAGIISPLAEEFCLPFTSGRGYCSLRPRAKMAERFERSGKDKLVVILVSDFDPEGEDIARSFARSMRDDFHITSTEAIKAALTPAQIKRFKLPSKFKAKKKSSRRDAFVAENGEDVWELEALPPATLQKVVRECILGVLHVELLNKEQRAEARDAQRLHGLREVVQGALADAADEFSDGDDDGDDEGGTE